MATVLVEHRWVVPLALLLLVTVGPVVAARAARRPVAAVMLVAIGTIPVFVLTLLPARRDITSGCVVSWTVPTFARVELAANVLLFVGAVLFTGVVLRRPFATLVAASGLSAAIETVQALAPSLGRSCATDDWLSNTIGAAIGACLAWVTLRWLGDARSSESADGREVRPCS